MKLALNKTSKLVFTLIASSFFVGLWVVKNYNIQSISSWNSSNSTSCSKFAYFNTVVTDANGDNAGACKLTDKTFDSNQVSCDSANQTCNQYLADLSVSTGVTKVYGGCYVNIASCINPDGQAASFRFFFDTVSKKCLSTNHRYNSSDVDVDDINHKTCLQSLREYQPNARQICYESKPVCMADNVPTPTPTATSISTTTPHATVTPTSTPVVTPIVTATPTVTPTSTPGEPNYCGGTCGSNYNCQGGLFCYQGFCRNPVCTVESDCVCKLSPTSPPVLGLTTTRILPKTGGGLDFVVLSVLAGGIGVFIFKKIRSLR